MGTTKKETNFWGTEKEVHYDDDGNKVGETRFEETFWGSPIQRHYDSDGKQVGSTRREEGVFSDKAVHRDVSGEVTGYSRNHETLITQKTYQKHYDTEGKLVGRTDYKERFFSNKHNKKHSGINPKVYQAENDEHDFPQEVDTRLQSSNGDIRERSTEVDGDQADEPLSKDSFSSSLNEITDVLTTYFSLGEDKEEDHIENPDGSYSVVTTQKNSTGYTVETVTYESKAEYEKWFSI